MLIFLGSVSSKNRDAMVVVYICIRKEKERNEGRAKLVWSLAGVELADGSIKPTLENSEAFSGTTASVEERLKL